MLAEHNSSQLSIFRNSHFWNFLTFFWVTCFSKTIWNFEFAFATQYWAHLILPSTSFLFLKKQNGGAEIFSKIMFFSKTIQNVGFWFTARSCMPLGLPSTTFVFFFKYESAVLAQKSFFGIYDQNLYFFKKCFAAQ